MTIAEEETLTFEAEQAWLAYLAMGESKQAYFGFLQALDQKYDNNGSPTIAENLKLEQLLEVHDEKVKAFNEAMADVDDTDARNALLAKLTSASAGIGAH